MGQHKTLTDEVQRKKNSEKWQSEKDENRNYRLLKRAALNRSAVAARTAMQNLLSKYISS